jgi:hypothetical protein
VIAVDPKSVLSPEPIFELFRNELNMTIITWTDTDFVQWDPLPPNMSLHVLTTRHLRRQGKFLAKCMEFLNQQGRSWTALWDTDEYIIFNGYNRSVENGTTPHDLAESGSILEFIQKSEGKPCYPMMKLEVGTKEDPSVSRRSISIPNLDPQRLDTLRYQYKNRWGTKDVGNGIGKAFLNVRKVKFPCKVLTPHRPVMNLCPPPQGKFVKESPFLLLHYVGSWESFSFRNSTMPGRVLVERSSGGGERNYRTSMSRLRKRGWKALFRMWESSERRRLLRHAGLPRGYNGSVLHCITALIAAEENATIA